MCLCVSSSSEPRHSVCSDQADRQVLTRTCCPGIFLYPVTAPFISLSFAQSSRLAVPWLCEPQGTVS